MRSIPLRFGPLQAAGLSVRRSGLRWLHPDGYVCRAGEPIAYCNIGFVDERSAAGKPLPFSGEVWDLQVAFATRTGGRVRQVQGMAPGGFLAQQHHHYVWQPNDLMGHLDVSSDASESAGEDDQLRLLTLAGQRMTDLAEDRSGLLTGWHERKRACWDDLGHGPWGTLVGAGICELPGIIQGENGAFLELFEILRGRCHVVMASDVPLVPSVQVLTDQLTRTPEQSEVIEADLTRSVTGYGPLTPPDWLFVGALASALRRTPLTDHYDVLSRTGLSRTGPADAVLLSLNAEMPQILRHRRLGYALNVYAFRLAQTGDCVRAWLRENFEAVPRTTDDILRDYRSFLRALSARSAAQVIIINSTSTHVAEEVLTYAGFGRPLSQYVSSIRRKELNLMLEDLGREFGVAIIDADGIAAELGSLWHMPDGIHHSGRLQSELRLEIVRALHEKNVPGFAPTRSGDLKGDQPFAALRG